MQRSQNVAFVKAAKILDAMPEHGFTRRDFLKHFNSKNAGNMFWQRLYRHGYIDQRDDYSHTMAYYTITRKYKERRAKMVRGFERFGDAALTILEAVAKNPGSESVATLRLSLGYRQYSKMCHKVKQLHEGDLLYKIRRGLNKMLYLTEAGYRALGRQPVPMMRLNRAVDAEPSSSSLDRSLILAYARKRQPKVNWSAMPTSTIARAIGIRSMRDILSQD